MTAHPFAPRDMADAYAVATDPARHMCRLDTIQSNWAFLKEARGQPVDLDRLLMASHLVQPAPRAETLHVETPDGRRVTIPCITHRAPPPVTRALPRSDNLRAVNPVDAARIHAIPATLAAIAGHAERLGRSIFGGDEPKGAA